MNFTYKLTSNPNQILRSDGAIIPNAPNGDWKAYEDWLADGNVPLPAEPLSVAIREIDARQLRLALLQMELLDDIEAALSQLGRAAQIEWEYATNIREDYPLVLALATNLGLDTKEIFDLANSFN